MFCPVSICRSCFHVASPQLQPPGEDIFRLQPAQLSPALPSPGRLQSILLLSSFWTNSGRFPFVSESMSSLGVKTGAHNPFIFLWAKSLLELNFTSRGDKLKTALRKAAFGDGAMFSERWEAPAGWPGDAAPLSGSRTPPSPGRRSLGPPQPGACSWGPGAPRTKAPVSRRPPRGLCRGRGGASPRETPRGANGAGGAGRSRPRRRELGALRPEPPRSPARSPAGASPWGNQVERPTGISGRAPAKFRHSPPTWGLLGSQGSKRKIPSLLMIQRLPPPLCVLGSAQTASLPRDCPNSFPPLLYPRGKRWDWEGWGEGEESCHLLNFGYKPGTLLGT